MNILFWVLISVAVIAGGIALFFSILTLIDIRKENKLRKIKMRELNERGWDIVDEMKSWETKKY